MADESSRSASPGGDASAGITQRRTRQATTVVDAEGSGRPLNRRETSRTAASFNPYAEEAAPSSPNGSRVANDLQPNRRSNTAQPLESSTSGGHDSTTTVQKPAPAHWGPDNEGSTAKAIPKPPSPVRVVWWLVICIAFVILAPVISIVMGATLHSREMTYPGDDGLPKFDGRTIDFEIVLISADPKTGSMRMDWRILGEVNSPCSRDNLSACTEVEIMFDTNLLRAEGTHSTEEDILTSDPPERPIFRFNATAHALGDFTARTPTFRTQLALFSPDRPRASLIFYPFDSYTAEIIFFGRERDTNNPVGVSIAKSRGIAVGLETSFTHTYRENLPPGLVEATLVLTRSTLVKSYSIVATIAIWFITIILALVMITSVFFGFKQRGEVLLIPVATLFAFTQLRQSMPGAPDGFGDIMDLVGLVPCLALLALTAAFSLGAFILTDPTNQPRQIRYKMMRDALAVLKEPEDSKASHGTPTKNP